jgi:hypothetical protein
LQAVVRRRSSAKRIGENEECNIDDVLITIDEG